MFRPNEAIGWRKPRHGPAAGVASADPN